MKGGENFMHYLCVNKYLKTVRTNIDERCDETHCNTGSFLATICSYFSNTCTLLRVLIDRHDDNVMIMTRRLCDTDETDVRRHWRRTLLEAGIH